MNEIWKDIKNYEGLYHVSNLGRVKSIARKIINGRNLNECIRKIILADNGYNHITLHKNGKRSQFLVHRLVAKTFILNPKNKFQVNHINGIKNDNRVENLEWCDAKENKEHAIKILGVDCKGVNHGLAKLTNTQIYEIKNLLKCSKLTHRKIAKIYGVVHSTIGRINRNQIWKHI